MTSIEQERPAERVLLAVVLQRRPDRDRRQRRDGGEVEGPAPWRRRASSWPSAGRARDRARPRLPVPIAPLAVSSVGPGSAPGGLVARRTPQAREADARAGAATIVAPRDRRLWRGLAPPVVSKTHSTRRAPPGSASDARPRPAPRQRSSPERSIGPCCAARSGSTPASRTSWAQKRLSSLRNAANSFRRLRQRDLGPFARQRGLHVERAA